MNRSHWYYNKPNFNYTTLKRWTSGGGDKGEAEAGITGAGDTMYSRGKATPEEEAQYTGSFDIGKLLQQLYQYQMGTGTKPSGYMSPEQQYLQQGGELGKAYYGQTLRGVQDPYAAYESTLQPQLQLAEDYINRSAQSRGLLRSGIPIEQLGRAGVELSIKQAQDRMNFRGQELARGGELSSYSTGLGQQNTANLQNLYGQQQGYGLSAQGRQAGQAKEAAQYQAYPYQQQLGYAAGQQGNTGSAIGGGLGALGGMALGAAFAPATGGFSLMYPLLGAGVGGTAGSQIGRAF